jgi:hypothetical protein
MESIRFIYRLLRAIFMDQYDLMEHSQLLQLLDLMDPSTRSVFESLLVYPRKIRNPVQK